MENNKPQVGSSSTPSITSQLFGPKDSSSNDVFASIFPPKGVGRNSEARGPWQKEPSGIGNQPWNGKQDSANKHGDANYGNSCSKERSSMYQQEGAEPSYLSSSLYYGGQESYSKATSHPTNPYPMYKKEGGEDDSSGASRGNWWQGSLYY